MLPAAPILLFDSGVGGLSILRALKKAAPHAPIVYAADFAGLPYGSKTEAEIAARVPALLGRLVERYRPRLVTIACNTASTIALPAVRAALDIPVVGTVPAVKPAAEQTRSGVIGLIGTQATIRQTYVDNLLHEHGRGATLIRIAAPELVEAAERKLRGQANDAAVFAGVMGRLLAAPDAEGMDIVVLACTHFPLLTAELAAARPALHRWRRWHRAAHSASVRNGLRRCRPCGRPVRLHGIGPGCQPLCQGAAALWPDPVRNAVARPLRAIPADRRYGQTGACSR